MCRYDNFMRARAFLLSCVLTLPCLAADVSRIIVARSVDENSCAAPKPVSSIDASAREAFVWFRAAHLQAGEELKIEWISPDGAVAQEGAYQDLPAASSLCFAARLAIAGFAQPGAWTVRVSSGARTLGSAAFRIIGDSGALRVTGVRRSSTATGIELTIDGAGFSSESMVHIAQYTEKGGWRYVAAAQPRLAGPNQLIADHAALPAAEYLVIIRNANGQLSRPFPFVIPTGGYKLPMVAGEPWIITQGPYGTFSHWGRTMHAYDIAPLSGRCIVAMRAGVVHIHDVGARQDHVHRTFGNYISIDHGDGQYSHYAHLASGTFVVSEGQHVEQGQALAIVGNSGYTLGEGGGYHVHVQVTRSPAISSPSVPFLFEDLTGPSRGRVVSSNTSDKCDCGVRYSGTRVAAAPAPSAPKPQFTARIGFSEWWSELVSVPSRAPSFDAKLEWADQGAGLDLHLVSPSGHHYAWYADPTGYSGSSAGPQEYRIANPEAGTWRISVQAVRGGSGPIEFSVISSGQKPGATPRRAFSRGGRGAGVRQARTL